jgi:hypothetical protein
VTWTSATRTRSGLDPGYPAASGPVAQRIERRLPDESRPSAATFIGSALPARVSGGVGQSPPPRRRLRCASGPVAQRIERRTSNPCAEVRLLPGPSRTPRELRTFFAGRREARRIRGHFCGRSRSDVQWPCTRLAEERRAPKGARLSHLTPVTECWGTPSVAADRRGSRRSPFLAEARRTPTGPAASFPHFSCCGPRSVAA